MWILVRPSFQLLPWYFTVLGVLLSWKTRQDRIARPLRETLIWHGIYCFAWNLPLFIWSANVYHFTGHWGLSHQLGASLTNHTGAFMEMAPAEYGILRDRYVEEKQKRGGNWINVFDAISGNLSQETGSPLWELSIKYKEIDKYLLRRYFKAYLHQVANAWKLMWSEPSFYLVDCYAEGPIQANGLPPPLPQYTFVRVTPVVRTVYGHLDGWFWTQPSRQQAIPWVMAIATVVFIITHWRFAQAVLAVLLICGTVFYHMAVHAAVQFTEFGRYRLPVQPLWWSFLWFSAIYCLWLVWTVLQRQLQDDERAELS